MVASSFRKDARDAPGLFADAPANRNLYGLGFACLLVTIVGWGLGWPIMKLLIREVPPLTARGFTGLAGGAFLFTIGKLRGSNFRVGREFWPKLSLLAFLNVGCWLALMGLALWWLTASEAVIVAYTMPVWASLFAWPLLGERPTVLKLAALFVSLFGIAILTHQHNAGALDVKLTGFILALAGAVLFALGTVLTKKLNIALSSLVSTTWQLLIACGPVMALGLIFERPALASLTTHAWLSLGYFALIGFGLCYLTWFAALNMLPAALAATGTLLIPAVGVCASALMLGEPLGVGRLLALGAIVAGVFLATRSSDK